MGRPGCRRHVENSFQRCCIPRSNPICNARLSSLPLSLSLWISLFPSIPHSFFFLFLSLSLSLSQKKHSNWSVQTQSRTLLLTVVAASWDVLLSLPPSPLSCCLCIIMFVAYFVLLPCCVAAMLFSCCVATMLSCHVLLPCCVVVLGLSLGSVVVSAMEIPTK